MKWPCVNGVRVAQWDQCQCTVMMLLHLTGKLSPFIFLSYNPDRHWYLCCHYKWNESKLIYRIINQAPCWRRRRTRLERRLWKQRHEMTAKKEHRLVELWWAFFTCWWRGAEMCFPLRGLVKIVQTTVYSKGVTITFRQGHVSCQLRPNNPLTRKMENALIQWISFIEEDLLQSTIDSFCCGKSSN